MCSVYQQGVVRNKGFTGGEFGSRDRTHGGGLNGAEVKVCHFEVLYGLFKINRGRFFFKSKDSDFPQGVGPRASTVPVNKYHNVCRTPFLWCL